ncbi:ABC transporter substrate-binding protein [Alicyclobacillus tolerans]|uniref:ABC transporter substrate-binding protein n=1 Tax=Alicyclobacillus tolerans TaxID=90970 RepID=UPI001F283139|nr:ABC transporter substrate-binding protein [Alicyclobacillus tolerans]MCF8564711.1 ABC transporter substrate-binding protein [Alicyclobacillus tolerans]
MKQRWFRTTAVFAVTAGMVGLVAGCGSSGGSNNASSNAAGNTAATQNGTSSQGGGTASTQTITVGTTPLVSSAPIFLAEDLGYWKKLGLNVQLKTYQAAGDIDIATAANSLDVSATGITASLFNLWNTGKKEYIVADKGRIWPGQHFEALIASNKAWNSGVHTVADLKGKRFGNTATGSTFDYLLGTMLAKSNLSLKDIQDVPLQTVPNLASAVETGQVDAVILPQPAANTVLKSGKGHLIAWVDNQVKADLLVIAYSPNFKTQTSAATKFMEGYLEAVQFYMKHVYHNTNASDPNLKKALAILSKYTKQPASVIPSELIYIDPNAQVDAASIQNQLNFYEKAGYVQGKPNVNDMIDGSFLQQAAQKLGS